MGRGALVGSRLGLITRGVLAHLAIDLGGRVSGARHGLLAIGIDLVPAIQQRLLLVGLAGEPGNEGELVDGLGQVGIDVERLGVQDGLLLGELRGRREQGVLGVGEGARGPVP